MIIKLNFMKTSIFILSFICSISLENKSYAQNSYRTLNPAEYGTTDQNAILICYNAEDTFRRLIIPMFLHGVPKYTVQKSLMNFQSISNTLWIALESMVESLYPEGNPLIDEYPGPNAFNNAQGFTKNILNTGDFKKMCAKAYLLNR